MLHGRTCPACSGQVLPEWEVLRLKSILSVRNLGIAFGSNEVLKSVNFDVYEQEVLGVIGPNGAGKTVMLNILSGLLKPTHGTVTFLEKDITRTRITERTYMGIGRTFQIPRSFEGMTVYENVLTGGVYGRKLSEREAEKNAVEILALIGLRDSAYKKAGKLGLLDRKRLEIGIALASRPKLILLDEVAGGLTNSEVAEIMKIVETIKAQGLSVIWIEHVMQTMIEGTDRVMLLSDGRDILTATAPVIMVSREVSEVYLGAEDDE